MPAEGKRPLTESDLLRWSESLAAIARTGMGFTQSLYERERFEEVLAVAGLVLHCARPALLKVGFDADERRDPTTTADATTCSQGHAYDLGPPSEQRGISSRRWGDSSCRWRSARRGWAGGGAR